MRGKRGLIAIAGVLLLCASASSVAGKERLWRKLGPGIRVLMESKGHEQYTRARKDASGDYVRLIVHLNTASPKVINEDLGQELENKVNEMGGVVGAHFLGKFEVFLPLQRVGSLASWEAIKKISIPIAPKPNRIITEGLEAMGVNNWHSEELAGSGVKIGIIDVGFKGYSSLLGSELPSSVVTKAIGMLRDFESTPHGTACAEVVADVAPDAGLFLVCVQDMDVGFGSAINWLRSQGADVILSPVGMSLGAYCDSIYDSLSTSGPEDAVKEISDWNQTADLIKASVEDAVSSGVIVVQSAGNDADKKWEGTFKDTDGDFSLNFSSNDNYNEIDTSDLGYGQSLSIVLLWGDEGTFQTQSDFDLYIWDEFDNLVASSEVDQSVHNIGIEACRFTPEPGIRYFAEIAKSSGQDESMTLLLGNDQGAAFEYYTAAGSVMLNPPANDPNVLTVGAVPYYNTREIQPYSSQGPGEGSIVKPDFVAPDLISTLTYGAAGFGGTSAAAAHVAGICALIKSLHPTWSPFQVRSYLTSNAVDLGPTGADNTYGNGLVMLPLAGSESSLYFPHIAVISNTWNTDIVVINADATDAVGTFHAYNDEGTEVSTLRDISIPPRGRFSANVAEEFSNADEITNIIFKSNSRFVIGCATFYGPGKSIASAPAVRVINLGDLYLPHIASNEIWYTGVALLNTTNEDRNLEIEFNNGNTVPLVLPGKAHKAFLVRSLLKQSELAFVDSAVIRNARGVVGVQIISSIGHPSEARLCASDVNDRSYMEIYFPHVACTGGWGTGVVTFTPSKSSQGIYVDLYEDSGEIVQSEYEEISLEQRWVGTLQKLGLSSLVGWFQISSDYPIAGFEAIGTMDATQICGFLAPGVPHRKGVFPRIDAGGYSGLAFVNTESVKGDITIRLRNDDGNVVAQKTWHVQPHAKLVNTLRKLLDRSDLGNGTYVEYQTTINVVSLQVGTSSNGLMMEGTAGLPLF